MCREPGSIGECMEYTIRNNLFMEMVSLAQLDNPKGLFSVCLNFIMQMISKI